METISLPQVENALKLNTFLLKKGALVLRAMDNHLRQRIMKQLHQSGRLCVKEIYKKLNIEQSVASSHLAILRKEGFVINKKQGKEVYYTINYERLSAVHDRIKLFLK